MKNISHFLLILLSLSARSQTGNAVFLKWKLQPKETIIYKASMAEDMASLLSDTMFQRLMDSAKNVHKDISQMLSRLTENQPDVNIRVKMQEAGKDIIDVELTMKTDATPDKKQKMATKDPPTMNPDINNDLMLRGAITENGAIRSFYLKTDQKNLLATFFELPGKPVSIGDTWPLSVSLIQMDQNFKCDTSARTNEVMLRDILVRENDSVALLQYNIAEYASGNFNNPLSNTNQKTTREISHHGTAEFSITNGRWISYDVIMGVKATGFMLVSSKKHFVMKPE
jgi:hypothetical protein